MRKNEDAQRGGEAEEVGPDVPQAAVAGVDGVQRAGGNDHEGHPRGGDAVRHVDVAQVERPVEREEVVGENLEHAETSPIRHVHPTQAGRQMEPLDHPEGGRVDNGGRSVPGRRRRDVPALGEGRPEVTVGVVQHRPQAAVADIVRETFAGDERVRNVDRLQAADKRPVRRKRVERHDGVVRQSHVPEATRAVRQAYVHDVVVTQAESAHAQPEPGRIAHRREKVDGLHRFVDVIENHRVDARAAHVAQRPNGVRLAERRVAREVDGAQVPEAVEGVRLQ